MVKTKLLNRQFAIKTLLTIIILSLLGVFFSYRLLKVPTGLTVDEAAFGYNAVLLERTGHDQNGRFLPFFVLSIHGREWRQPVTQYYMALFFKIFGASVYNLRFTSITIALFSTILLFALSRQLLTKKVAIFSAIVFVTTPLIMIQSHMGLDNIMPIPFAIVWLMGLLFFAKNKKKKYLVLAGISLGISFYTYKGMRATVPVWAIISVFYLIWQSLAVAKLSLKKTIINISVFSLAILPFFAIIPILNVKYAGAVFDRQSVLSPSVYDFLYRYFSSFDPSFLFIKGDDLLFHSTQRHGMMLLASLPFFLMGCYQVLRKKGDWILVLVVFFSTPLLYGFVDSVHRASRLMAMIPFYCLITALGITVLGKNALRKIFMFILVILMAFNYFDFVKYYWFTYPGFSESTFGHLEEYLSYEVLAKESKARNLEPYIYKELAQKNGEIGNIFETIYFKTPLKRISYDESTPESGILLTFRKEMPGMKTLDIKLPFDFLLLSTPSAKLK